jgi:hypothetical protein
MSFVRCDACRGQKKVRALGCLMKKCFECQGTGYLEVEEQEHFESDKQVMQDEVKQAVEVNENKEEVALPELDKKTSRFKKKKE